MSQKLVLILPLLCLGCVAVASSFVAFAWFVMNSNAVKAPASTQPPGKGRRGKAPSGSSTKVSCNKNEQPGWEYTRRAQTGGKWKCPAGFIDNGCTWADGPKIGELQCKRKVPEGEWISQEYGGPGGVPFDERCANGHFLSGIAMYHGERDLNGIFAQCYDPTGIVPPYTLFKSAPNGIRGKAEASANAGLVALDKVVSAVGMGGFSGNKTHPTTGITDSVQGFYKWDIKTKKPDGKDVRDEVQGLKVYAKDGRDTGQAGGSSKYDNALTLHAGQCPPGKVITGIAGKNGARVDSLKFICNAPGGT